MEKLKEVLAAIADKTNKIKVLQYMQKALAMLLPVTLVGSIFALLAGLPFDAWTNFLETTGLGTHFTNVYNCTYGYYSLFLAFCMAYQYCLINKQRKSAVPAGIIAVGAFLITCPVGDPSIYIGTAGMLGAMVVGGLTGWAFKFFIERNITIKMPEGVPPMVAQSFIALIPASVVIIVAMILNTICSYVGLGSLQDIVYTIVRVPLTTIGANAIGEFVITMYCCLLWFFGIHGGMVVGPIVSVIFMDNCMANLAAYTAGEPMPYMFTGGILMGMGLATNLAILVASHRAEVKEVAKMGIVPYIFNIQEPTSFGVPIITNPNFFIPYVFSGVISWIITHGAQAIGFLGYCNCASVNWTVPSPIAAFLNYGWQGTVVDLIITVVTFFLFIPFVKMNDAALDKADAKVNK